MTKPRIKLMADYRCHPLWHDGGAEIGNIDPAEIGLSEDLLHDMDAWVAIFESHLDLSDPASCSWTKAEEAEFDRIGLGLRDRLTEEVGNRYAISYHGLNIKSDEA